MVKCVFARSFDHCRKILSKTNDVVRINQNSPKGKCQLSVLKTHVKKLKREKFILKIMYLIP